MRHSWRVLKASWRLSFKAAALFRGDLAIGTAISLAWLGFAIAPVLVAGRYLGEGDGWTQARLLFLQAVWYWMDAVMWVFLYNNIRELRDDVRQGRLDGKLLLPTDSLTYVMLGRFGYADAPKFLIAVALGAWAVAAGAFPGSAWHVAAFLVCLAAASVILWAVAVFSSYKVITLFNFDANVALDAVHNLARVPTGMYGTVLRVLLSSALPVILLTTVPSTVFVGWSRWWAPLISVGAAILLVALMRVAWRRETRLYVGLQS
ncbi:MAG: ABC-2 family transporter protein [Bifidobacteriaceae bacterium]|nr:ABC-2 family transporter protein [Bifidobacteriaceae bacterium]